MNSNISSGFSPESGFFRDADKGGGGGGGKDDKNNIPKKDKEPLDVLSQLRNNLKEIEALIRDYDPLSATSLLRKSRELIKSYQPSSEEEKAALLFFINRLKLKAEALHFDMDNLGDIEKKEQVKAVKGIESDGDKEDDGMEEHYVNDFQEVDNGLSGDGGGSNHEGDNGPNGDEGGPNHLISLVKQNLFGLENQRFAFSEDQDQVAEAFEETHQIVLDLKRDEKIAKETLRNIEIEVLILEYKKRREAILNTLTNMEKSQSLGENSFIRAIENPGLGEMKNIVSNLEKLGLNDVGSFETDLSKIKDHYFSRKWLLLTWIHVRAKIFDGVGDDSARTSFGQVGEQEFPISGKDFDELILGGVDFDPNFGNPLNQQFKSTNRIVKKFIEEGDSQSLDFDKKIENKEVNETLFTFCMQQFDNIYKNGAQIKDSNGKVVDEITTRNLREKQSALVKFVAEKARVEMPELSDKIDDHAVELAFRAHILLTMHHCRFASGSPSLKDDWYYAFRFPEYVVKYAKYGVDKFDPYLTFLLFGTRPGLKENGKTQEAEATDSNTLSIIFSKARVNRVMRLLKKKGLWNERKRGLRNFDGLVNGYSILLEDVSPNISASPELIKKQVIDDFKMIYPNFDEKDLSSEIQEEVEKREKEIENSSKADYSFLSPPLRYLKQKSQDGDVMKHLAPNGREGKHVLLDDLVDERGNIVYGLINYEKIGTDLAAYYNSMNQHGIDNFLNKFVKADRYEFMKNAESPSSLKSLKNEARYTAELLPRVGIFARMGMKDIVKTEGDRDPLANAIMDRILIQVIFINCILHTSLSATNDVFWTDKRVKSYLVDLVSAGVISKDEREAIELAVREYRGDSLIAESLKRGVTEQIKKANIYK